MGKVAGFLDLRAPKLSGPSPHPLFSKQALCSISILLLSLISPTATVQVFLAVFFPPLAETLSGLIPDLKS